ncbi:MAG TPA: BBP7 family outer membrane beta-barrel protein, partial [Pirellulaceae bacterium]
GSDWQAVSGETIVDGQIMGPTMGNGQIMGPTMGNGQIISGPGYSQGMTMSSGPSACSSCGNDLGGASACSSCGTACETVCNPCPCPPKMPEICGPPGWLWLRGEYLIWFGEEMDVPPLVTTGSTANPGTAGVLGETSTDILYGDTPILDGGRSGYRIEFGGWFGPRRCVGWEGEFFELGGVSETFIASSDPNGNPVIARPFVNVNVRDANGNLLPGTNDAQLVSFPGILAGTIIVDSDSALRSAAGRFRFNVCCKKCCPPCATYGPGGYNRCGYPPFMKVDFTAGYRYGNLNEQLLIAEDVQSLQDPERIQVYDVFRTRNDFHGGEIGTAFESGWNRWSLEMLMRLAIGGVRQEVEIDGGTTITTFGNPAQQAAGGLLAQTTNIGTYTQNDFAMIPELGVNLGLYLTPRLRWIVGYTFFYFSNVARPGDQIDLDVNPDFIPPAAANPVGLDRPEFTFHESDFFAQGINTGLDFRW